MLFQNKLYPVTYKTKSGIIHREEFIYQVCVYLKFASRQTRGIEN